jgi:hypothetical protein
LQLCIYTAFCKLASFYTETLAEVFETTYKLLKNYSAEIRQKTKAATSIGPACPSMKNHRCQYLRNCLWTSSDVTGSLTSNDIGGISCFGTPDLYYTPRGQSSPLGAKFTPWGQVHPLGPSSPLRAKFNPWGQDHPWGLSSTLGAKFTP